MKLKVFILYLYEMNAERKKWTSSLHNVSTDTSNNSELDLYHQKWDIILPQVLVSVQGNNCLTGQFLILIKEWPPYSFGMTEA